MGLLDTVRNALGLQKPLQVQPAGPLKLADSARKRLAGLGSGHGVHLSMLPDGRGGYQLLPEEGPAQGPSPEGLDGVTAGRAALQHLEGLTLVWDGQWGLQAPLDVRGSETPNPNGRLYKFSRVLANSRGAFADVGSSDPHPLLRDVLAHDAVSSVFARDNTLTVERVPDAPWDLIDQHVARAVRDGLLSAYGQVSAEAADPLHGDLMAVLERTVLPRIHADGGSLEILDVVDGTVRVRLVGACKTCPASALTLKAGVERVLKDAFPGRIERVEAVDGPA